MTLFARTDRSIYGRWWWTVDKALLSACVFLMLTGIVLVAAASPPVAQRIGIEGTHFIMRHLIYLVPSGIALIAISMLSPRMIWRLATLVLAGALVGLMIVPFVGAEIKGAQRWLHIFGFSIQPSEFAKPAFAVVAAWLMALQREKPEFPGDLISAGLYVFVIMLLLIQPDLGMSVIMTLMFAGQIFLAGLPFRYLLIFGAVGICAMVAVYAGFDHVQSRIDRFLDPAGGDSYQVETSMQAFRSGGIFGTGPGQGEVKMHLPDGHADFIFAVAGEELGLVFMLVLTGVFVFIILRVLHHLRHARDMFSVLGGGGLVIMFGLQALVHMGSTLHLLPTKGMTLPFISYGGSSLLAMALAMGMILGLTRRDRHSSIARTGWRSGSV